jgi:nucleoside diphosphate kinase
MSQKSTKESESEDDEKAAVSSDDEEWFEKRSNMKQTGAAHAARMPATRPTAEQRRSKPAAASNSFSQVGAVYEEDLQDRADEKQEIQRRREEQEREQRELERAGAVARATERRKQAEETARLQREMAEQLVAMRKEQKANEEEEKRQQAIEKALAKEKADAARAEAQRIAAERAAAREEQLAKQKLEADRAFKEKERLETIKAEEVAREKERLQKVANRRRQIETSIFDSKVGEPIFDSSISYENPLPTLPPALWHRLFAYPEFTDQAAPEKPRYFEEEDSDLGSLGQYSVLVFSQSHPVFQAVPSAFSDIMAWVLTGCAHHQGSARNERTSNSGGETFPFCPFQVQALSNTVLVPPFETPLLLPPHPSDPRAEKTVVFAVKQADGTGSQPASVFADHLRSFMVRTRLTDVLSAETAAAVQAQDGGVALALDSCMAVVRSLGQMQADPSGQRTQKANEIGADQPLHLFTRLPAFHSYASSSMKTNGSDGEQQQAAPPQGAIPETITCVLKPHIFTHKACLAAVLQKIESEGLDLVGMRLLYVTVDKKAVRNSPRKGALILPAAGYETRVHPIVALAIRGQNAAERWANAVGPEDPKLALITDPMSLRAACADVCTKNDNLVSMSRPRLLYQDLTFFFGGRILLASDGITMAGPPTNLSSSVPRPRPCFCILPVAVEQTVLVLSPSVPPAMYGDILQLCASKGFSIAGMKRILASRTAACMDASVGTFAAFLGEFCSVAVDDSPCLIVVFSKESAVKHFTLLVPVINAFVRHGIADKGCTPAWATSTVADASSMQTLLANEFRHLPSETAFMESMAIKPQKFVGSQEIEDVAVLAVSSEAFQQLPALFAEIFGCETEQPKPGKREDTAALRFELVALKYLPSLTDAQAPVLESENQVCGLPLNSPHDVFDYSVCFRNRAPC